MLSYSNSVDLLDKTMVDDARTLLVRANELAGSGEPAWDLTVVSPIFAADALPERWANLVAVEVERSVPGFDTTTVALRNDMPSRTLTMCKPLSELVAGSCRRRPDRDVPGPQQLRRPPRAVDRGTATVRAGTVRLSQPSAED